MQSKERPAGLPPPRSQRCYVLKLLFGRKYLSFTIAIQNSDVQLGILCGLTFPGLGDEGAHLAPLLSARRPHLWPTSQSAYGFLLTLVCLPTHGVGDQSCSCASCPHLTTPPLHHVLFRSCCAWAKRQRLVHSAHSQ